MRWERLFTDLEAEYAALSHAHRAAEISERARIEAGRLHLSERVEASLGSDVQVRVTGGRSVRGRLQRSGPGWLLLVEPGGADCLVVTAQVLSVTGLVRWSVPSADVCAGGGVRFGIGHVLRALCTERASLSVALLDGSAVTATIDRVGRDFLDVTVHEAGQLSGRRAHSSAVVRRDAVVMIRRLP